MEICKIQNCNKAVKAKNVCSMHYQRFKFHGHYEGKSYIKLNCKIQDCINKEFSKNVCNMHYLRFWHHGSFERINKKYNEYGSYKKILPSIMNDMTRFGGLREEVIKRDNYQCLHCGMTREEHKKKWNLDITIDHIDGYGTHSVIKHNYIENLQTLCLRCHGKLEASRFKHRKEVENRL